jgi:hypothetical protein
VGRFGDAAVSRIAGGLTLLADITHR